VYQQKSSQIGKENTVKPIYVHVCYFYYFGILVFTLQAL